MKCKVCGRHAEYMINGNSFCEIHRPLPPPPKKKVRGLMDDLGRIGRGGSF